MFYRIYQVLLLSVLLWSMPTLSAALALTTPPQAAKVPYTLTSAHGERVDPFYWLRDDQRQDPKVLSYLSAENAYYEQYSARYQALTSELTAELIGRIKQDESSVPYIKGDYLYATHYEPGLEYPIYVRQPLSGGVDHVILDINELAAGQDFYQVTNLQISPNQRYLAYIEDTSGRRQGTLRIRDLTTGKTLADTLPGLSSSIAWSADSQYLFLVRNDPVTLLGNTVLRHQVGHDPAKAAVVYQEKDNSFYLWVTNSQDNRYVLINLDSTISSETQVLDASTPTAAFQVFAPRQPDFKYEVEHLEQRWVIRTDWQAPNYRLMTVVNDKLGNRAHWQALLPHDEHVFIQDFVLFQHYLAINERSDGLRRIRIVPWQDLTKAFYIRSDEAAYVTAFEINAEQNTALLRYTYTSLTTPSSVYQLNMDTGETTLLQQQTVLGGFESSQYVTERLWVPTNDGVKVPVSLLYHKSTARDGTAPLYQYAYGSYGSSSDPAFRSSVLSLVDRGFVYAIAHVRGGQELGRDWYEQGKLLSKIKTFTDYIAVTDYLVAEKYVAKDQVFGMGGSAGGLLMGAVANMAPTKYRALIAHVPFVDVVTTMLDESIPLTTNEFDEWGNPKQKTYYDYMLSYSPYDQVKAQAYPALLVTTGLHDSQVQYFEPAKWVAKLRDNKTDSNPLLFRINMEAGHGGKSGRFARLSETAQEYAFILDLLAQPR